MLRSIRIFPRILRTPEAPSVPAQRRSPESLVTPHPRGASGPAHPRELGATRLAVPVGLHTGLGCDAVGVPSRFGFKILSRLPAKGCVYADSDWWWWLVPAGSDLDLTWPLPACYAPGAEIPDRHPRLIHHPDGTSPYTPPIPLYLLVCQLTGIAPSWPAPPVRSAL
ncbi:hypothetical protein [Streptomyces tanashiensis]|uniref:Uncharacterized protein n=1 Tax=Streptomyces tanashiensis TaxID=67367 RepID=A0ABY6QSP5_9ACTN|nr:hypothetical protein [Streptomyces tanashiensis]UZX20672.1 hypothetical protein LDH80_08095 [Streptomyces tanashiensis]GGY37209.1 hypothetical protein GCM10010299_49540 [Streptomyces tanashiensis]